jgi:hypothetical protein
MKFDSVELERVVEQSLKGPRHWRPASHGAVHVVEAVVFGAVLGYWLVGVLGMLA